ncbi:MAG TPA: hypothetical protein ENN07_02970 [candidate division Zixibacteria bacterium]|nr:hypothetical protein [candidate division Zixibacteria bacterium]
MKAFVKILALLVGGSLFAAGLGGYYEVQTRLAEDGTWQLFEPVHRFELRLHSSPWENTEAFAKVFAELSRNQDNDPERPLREYTFIEGHLRYRWPKHIELHAFSRQNRFWFPQGLFELVNSDRLSDGGNSQGIRADFWGIGTLSGVLLYSDMSASGGDDALAGRLYAPFFDDRLRLSSVAARKDWGASTSDYNSVLSANIGASVGRFADFLRPLGNIDIEGQVAVSRIPDEPKDAENIAWSAEFRQLRVGGLELQGGYRDWGADFRSYLSNQFDYDQSFNEKGFYGRAVYFFPEKAINLYGGYSETRAPQNRSARISVNNPERTAQEAFGEVYIEWVNDIKSKVRYKHYRGWDANYREIRDYPELLGEVSVESRIAKVKAQVRVKDFGTDFQIIATGLEFNANLTHDLKFYARAVNAAEKSESRQTIFAQLRYERFQPAEIFLEFGNPGDTDNDLTMDDDFVNVGASHGVAKQVALFVKVFF